MTRWRFAFVAMSMAGLVFLAEVPPDSIAADGAATTTAPAPSRDWPRWRGPRGDNAPVADGFPRDVSKGLTKLWATTQLCEGKNSAAWSCPAIAGEKLVVTGRSEAKDAVWCLDAGTGKEIWKKQYAAPAGQDVQYGNGPRGTPAIEGDFVYTFGCMGHLACWSMADGKQAWIKNVEDLGGKRPLWGYASSPLIMADKVIVQGGGKALVVALDKKTGEKAWTTLEGTAGYAAATTATIGGKEQLIVFAGDSVLGLDPRDGSKLWRWAWPTAFGMNCTTPVQVGDKLLICSSEKDGKGGMVLLEFGSGEPKAVWTNHEVGPAHNDPVIVDGYAYAFSGFSIDKKVAMVCVNLATGKQKWSSEELGGSGTVVKVGDQLLCLGNGGKLALVKPSPEAFDMVSQFDAIKGFPVWTQPVIANGRLYLRFCNELICYTWEK